MSEEEGGKRLPIIAIIGRPNVGKSTIFNRLIGRRHAITSSVAGTTRDRIYHTTKIGDYPSILVDTGGLSFDKQKDLEEDIQTQARLGIADADVIYFVIDASDELTANDFEAAQILRKSKKPVMLIANKIDKKQSEENQYNLYELGFAEPILFSALSGDGKDELYSKTTKEFKKLEIIPYEESPDRTGINVSIIGRPNVGKSSFINAIVGEKRLLVSDTPGTTLDSTNTMVEKDGEHFTLIDTAGIRRRGKIEMGLEKFSFMRALDAIYRSDVTVLMIDYAEGLTSQDMHLVAYALDAGKGLILAVNKCDMMEDPKNDEARIAAVLRRRMAFVPWAPVTFISALTGKNVAYLFDIVKKINTERNLEVDPDKLDHALRKFLIKHPPPSRGAKFIKFTGAVQTGVRPPTFELMANYPDAVHFSYRRYLENSLRETFGFDGTAIRVFLKRGPKGKRY
jgi:GTPase